MGIICLGTCLEDKNMGNHNQKGPEFHKYGYTAMTDRPLGTLAKKAIAVKLEEDIDSYLRSLPTKERTILIRESITNAVKERMKHTPVRL